MGQPSTRPARPARRRLTREERTTELIEAAERIVIGEGADALTIERVAEVAGCSRNLAYSYFPNMTALLDAMRERQRTRLAVAVVERIPRPAAFDDWVAAWVGLVLDEATERGPLFILLFEGGVPQRRRAVSLGSVAGFEMRLLADRGMERPRARVVARLATGAIVAAAIAIAVDGSPREVVESELMALIRGLV